MFLLRRFLEGDFLKNRPHVHRRTYRFGFFLFCFFNTQVSETLPDGTGIGRRPVLDLLTDE